MKSCSIHIHGSRVQAQGQAATGHPSANTQPAHRVALPSKSATVMHSVTIIVQDAADGQGERQAVTSWVARPIVALYGACKQSNNDTTESPLQTAIGVDEKRRDNAARNSHDPSIPNGRSGRSHEVIVTCGFKCDGPHLGSAQALYSYLIQ
jgi:hypothetical protein